MNDVASPGAATLRAFFAVPIPDEARPPLRAVLQTLRARPFGDAVRWVALDNLHVTVRFLGDIPERAVAELVAAASAELATLPTGRLSLTPPFAFPDRRRPRVVALGVDGGAALTELARAVERAVRAAGFPADRRAFHPHLTLGRLRDRRLPALDLGWRTVELPLDAVVLYESQLLPGGARHLVRARLPLGGSVT
ncbi:MAG: RNA 2',3'-cyclic phosphodiesterase [Planctomycetes bacterium]|nr:RNA 2',3'-cyclic phosphodiesterase [Planctomycetota bacterium]